MTWFSEHKKILTGAAILCLVCGIGWGVYEHYASIKKPLVLYGNVDIRQVSLAFNSSERIDEMTKNEGDTVKKGEVLAKLNTRPLELAIERQKAAIAALWKSCITAAAAKILLQHRLRLTRSVPLQIMRGYTMTVCSS